jgi:hypothetical protein
MAHEQAALPDTAALLRQNLQQSWRRDRRIRAFKLPWRWGTWALARYGSSAIAAAVLVASTPDLWLAHTLPPVPLDTLILKPSFELSLTPTLRP